MKDQYYKVVDDNGRVLIPVEQRNAANILDNDIVRICVYNGMIIMEKVEIPYVDMVAKLKHSFNVPQEKYPEERSVLFPSGKATPAECPDFFPEPNGVLYTCGYRENG